MRSQENAPWCNFHSKNHNNSKDIDPLVHKDAKLAVDHALLAPKASAEQQCTGSHCRAAMHGITLAGSCEVQGEGMHREEDWKLYVWAARVRAR